MCRPNDKTGTQIAIDPKPKLRISPNMPTIASPTTQLIGGMNSGGVGNVGSIGIGVTLMPNSTSSLASVSGGHLQVSGGNQVGQQASPQAPTYVNL